MRKIVASLAITLVILLFLPQSPASALPDLVVQSVNAPSWAAQGSTISVTVIFKNQGTDLTHCCYVACRMIVSQDQDINLDDLYYPADKNIDNSLLEANESAPLNFTYTLPPNLSGPYYVGAYVDTGFWHTESNEGNNANYDPTPMFIGAPDPPALFYPSNEGSVPSGESINFQWTNQTGAVWTKIKVCSDPSMSGASLVISAEGESNTIVSDSFFAAEVTYYWQACSRAEGSQDFGVYGPTPPWSFTVEEPSLPDPPILSYPENGGAVLPGESINFQWTNSPGGVWTQIKICRDPSMSDVVVAVEGATNSIVSGGFFTAGETYYWQGRSRGENESQGYGLYGPTPPWSFTVEESGLPDPPILSHPENEGTVPSGENINFQWTNSPGGVWSKIKVCTDPSMSGPSLVISAEGESNTIVSDSFFTAGVTYYWQACSRAEGSQDFGVYGPTPPWSFTVSSPIADHPVFVPFYRLYKCDQGNNTRDHFYTTNRAERDNALATMGYTDEGIECYISDRNFAGAIPIYRLYKADVNSHFYTTSATEKNTKIAEGYVVEGPMGIVGFVYQSPAEGLVPLHRMKQTSGTPHHYFLSSSRIEYDAVLSHGYVDETSPSGMGYVQSGLARESIAHGMPQANFGGADLGTGAFRGARGIGLTMKGRGPALVFAHYYNSFDYDHYSYPMGPGWKHSLESSIDVDIDGNVFVKWPGGSISYFEKTGNGQTDYLDRSGNHDQLTRVDAGNGYDIRRKDQTVYRYRIYSVNPWPGTPPEEWFLQDNTKLLLIDITDWKGNRLTFYREAAYGTIEEVRDNMGRKLEFDYYSPAIQLREVKEVVGGTTKRSISFTYNSDGLLETFTDANGRTTRYAYYDEPATLRHNLLKSVTYPKGNTVTVHYDDATGQVDSIKDNDVSGSTITYTPSSNLTVTEVEDPEHNKYNYIHTGNLLTAFKGANEARRVTIDRTDSNNPNLPTKVTDKKGYTTEYEYDAMGNVTKIINDDGMVATFSYNDKNNIISSREFHDPNGTTPPPTTYTYQIDGNRLWRVTNPENETVELGYDANHQLTSVTDGRGYTTQFAYDSYGNLEQVTDAEGNTTVYENDYAGRVTSVTDAEGIKTAITYDANDNPLDVMNYARGEQTVLRTVSRLYDFNGNLDSVSWLNQGTSSQTRYTYDSQDRLHKVIKPGNLDKVFTHYETGLVKTRSDYNNDTTTYYYDDHNRLERTRYPDQTETTIIRDLNGNVTSVTGRNGTSSFTYDNLNRVETYTDPYNKTVQYDYDNAGRVSKITYPGSNEVDYTYDNAGRLETVTDWNNGSVTYVYDATGNLKEIQRSNGITTVYTYDRASRLTGITEKDGSTMLWSYTFELDGVGNHNAVDVVNEPLAFTAASEEVTYTNDRTNNRLLSAGSTSYTYDDNGNRKTSTEGGVTTTYTWDYENMLTGISTPGQTNIQHVYDAMGNRITRVVDGITARYVLDLNSDMSRVLAETHGSGVVTAYYIYGHGLISRIDASDNTRRFYHFNHRGDTVVLSDDSGTVNDEYAYGEYGQVQESPTNTTPNPFRYVGQYGVMDEGQNLYFMRARFYDPEIGRFLNEDPLGFEGGDWNLYAYVMGNPGTATDPLGLMDFGGMWKSAVDRAGKYADEALNWSAKRIEDAAQHVDRRLEELSLWRGRESGKGVGGCQELPYQTSTNIQFICVPMIGGAEEFPAYAVATLYVSGKRTIYDQTSPANMRNTIRAIRSGEAGEALRNSIRKGMEHWNDFWYPNGNPFRR